MLNIGLMKMWDFYVYVFLVFWCFKFKDIAYLHLVDTCIFDRCLSPAFSIDILPIMSNCLKIKFSNTRGLRQDAKTMEHFQ